MLQAHESSLSRRERVLALLEDVTSNAARVQDTILSQILAHNSNAQYLRRLLPPTSNGEGDDNGDIKSCVDIQPHVFKRIAPLTSYADMEPYIQRISDGDKSPLLTDSPVMELLRSSGTSSGMQKMFPAIEADLERRSLFFASAGAVNHRHFEGLDNGKDAIFLFVSPKRWTAGGVVTQPLMTSYLFSPQFEQYAKTMYTSPIEVLQRCEDVKQSTYCQLLCALLQRQVVVRLGAFFASGLLAVIQVLKDKWRELVIDIRIGSLNEIEVFDQRVREAVERHIEGPNPTLAVQVEEECCRKPLWQGIIRRLWPRAKFVSCAMTGSMEQYIPMLEFFSGGLPLVTTSYAASEYPLGINMNPLCSPYEVSYTILPNMAYFEFLPLDAAKDDDNAAHQSQLVDLVDVKLGEDYEVVVTTFAGLYRYRVGDCLQVTGFHNKTPQFRLFGRKNVALSVGIVKVEEGTLHKAVQMARMRHLERKSSYQVVDYTSYADVSTVPGHYVLFWELRDKVEEGKEPTLDSSVMEACCDTIEECFDAMYRLGKERKWIGSLEIRTVRQGTFRALIECSNVVVGVSLGQYKTPRVVKLAPLLELLDSRVSHSFSASVKAT
ncbi:hypothetical protein L7F22_067248 [Adiantum nelumboides]|nr:hypothetical protein [Adiantum nelumboides]